MADSNNQNANWQIRPPRPPAGTETSSGFPPPGSRPPFPANNMQTKLGQQVPNGPMPGQGGPQMFRPPPPTGVNGFSNPSVSTGLAQTNNQLPGPQPGYINGPSGPPPFRPGMPPTGGAGPVRHDTQFGPRPPMPPGPNSIPQMQGPAPPQVTTSFAAPGFPPPTSQGVAGPPTAGNMTPPSGIVPPSAIPSSLSQARPNELPVPFQGQGQYSHQVGMALTPGITPANSAPPSQKSSRTNSPMNQNFDALEGQFRGTPDQEHPAFPAPGQQGLQQPGAGSAFTPPGPGQQRFPPRNSPARFPSSVNSSFPGAPPPGVPGAVNQPRPQGPMTGGPGQRPGFPPGPPQPTNQPRGTAPAMRPGFQPPPSTTSATHQQPGQQPPSNNSQFPPRFPTQPNPQPFPAPPTTATQQPGFLPPPMTSANQQPGFPPTANQQPGFPAPPMSMANQQPGFPPTANQQPGFPPTANQQPGFPPTANQQPGFPPTANQQPGFPPPPMSMANQQPGFPPPPTANQQPPMTSANQLPGFPPPQPGFPTGPAGQGQTNNQQPGTDPRYGASGKTIQQFVNNDPKSNSAFGAMATGFNNMSLQGGQHLNLLQNKKLIPPGGVETAKPVIPNDNRNVNCNPDVFRCTLNAIPQTTALLNKSRLPLGILIHPFRDLSQLPVIQSSVIVRCRSCRTYINPFVHFVDSRRWKCNLCYRVNELPDEFSFDPVSKTYGDPQRRPEIRSATIEFIAPSEYMLRPPQPAVYLYLLDVSFNAIETGYLSMFCETVLDVLDRIPGDSRTQIGFIAYDSSLHFFNLAEGLSQPQMLTVSDVDDIFLPCPDNLLVNLNESRSLVIDLLNQLPTLFENNLETRSALGAALQASFKMMTSTGGRVTVMQTILPTHGPGALQNREDNTQKTSKDIGSLGPATDFYKKLALDCSAQQIAVDLFMFNGQYADMASIECISKYSGGCTYYYPSYHTVRAPHLATRYEADLRRYLTRKIGFESVMRIRCSKGLSIHTFHGNFFVRSTDLLSLPNVNPDAGYGMQMSIEEPLTDMSTMCFQAALLYTSSKGERRIRVHTLCLPVTNQLSDIHASADQQAIVGLLAKMAVDRSLSSSMSDAREAIVNAAIDTVNAYAASLPASQRQGMAINEQLRLIPLYCLALLKSTAFRMGVSTRLDERNFALQQCKTLPTCYLLQTLYPDLYPLHTIMDVEIKKKGQLEFADLPLIQLSSANIDRFGAYLLDAGDAMFLYLGSAISEQFCQEVLDVPNFASIREGGTCELPELENEGSERVRGFINFLLDGRPNGSALTVVREDGKLRMQFFSHFVEDKTESSVSYNEFLQQVQSQVKS